MKRYVIEFLKRGLAAAWGGPVVVAIVYAILGKTGVVETVTVREFCTAVLSSTFLAFIVAGCSMIYIIDKLPLVTKILLHGGLLYVTYLVIYLLNNWLARSLQVVGIFTGIFIIGYALIWLVVYLYIRSKTNQLNAKIQNLNS